MKKLKASWLVFGVVFALSLATIWVVRHTYAAYMPSENGVVFAYLPTPTNTTITTGGDYYPIAGAFVNDVLVGWSFVTDHIEYDYDKPRGHLFAWSMAFSTDGPLTTVYVAIELNGTAREAQRMGTIAKTAGDVYTVTGIDLVEISKGDEIQLVITSDGDGDVITVNHFVTIAVSIGA